MCMSSPLLTVDGMILGRHDLTAEQILDHAVVDADGRLLVSMIDALAIVRLRSDAELVLVEFADGASCALRVPEILDRNDVFLQLHLECRGGSVDGVWVARLWSEQSGPSAAMTSMSATSFAAFVGFE